MRRGDCRSNRFETSSLEGELQRSCSPSKMADLGDVLNPPSEDAKPLILVAIKEDEGRLEHNLQLLETWISCQSHLPKNYEKNLLVTFLRGCKHDMQRTKKKLESYFMIRTFDEAIMRNRILTMEGDLLPTTYLRTCPMPEVTPDGCRITLRTLTTKDDSIFHMHDYLRYELMIYDLRLHRETLTAGEVYVYDVRNIHAGHIPKILCAEFRKALDFVEATLPLRIKQVHVVTTSTVILKAIDLIKLVVSDKLAKRVFIHPTWESLYEEIPRRLFPSDFGGEKKSTREITEDWKAKLIESKDWFRRLDEVTVDGTAPKQFQQTFDDFYGPEGSFRRMNID